jgi:long-chain acyl-CoA synthetase
VHTGYALAFAESIDKLKNNLKEIEPTFIIAVPRIFEKIYAGVLAQVEQSPTKRRVFETALAIGTRFSKIEEKNKNPGLILSIENQIAKKLVFNSVLKAMGGRMRFAVSGGAPLNPEVAKFFHSMGLLICEGYGLTETTAGVCFNSPFEYKFGSVGKPLADVDIKIAENGEILVKSKKVMKEYYLDEAATREAFVDGYFRTGDIGHLDKDGFLFITDRLKDLIKTDGGKYVAPQRLENLLKTSPIISNVLIHGDQKKYIVALLTLNPPYNTNPNDPATYELVKNVVAEVNTNLASFESIKKFIILPKDFTVETGELTPSLKVKRRFCDIKFKNEIDSLY